MACLVLIVAALTPSPARAADESSPAAPILRVDTGMHGAPINRLALDEANKRFVTVSDDKTVRIWSLDDGSLKHVFRTDIAEADLGAVLAVALHGDVLVTGTRNPTGGGTLNIFDLKTETMRGTISGFATPVSALALSADGKLLAVGFQGKGGLRLFDLSANKLKAHDASYQDTINWIAFSSDGAIATTSADGEIRLLDGDLKELARTKLGTATDVPWGIAFSPDGSHVAIGDESRPDVTIFTKDGLKPLTTLHGGAGTEGDLSRVAWSADGKTLAASGYYVRAGGKRFIRFWTITGDKFDAPADVSPAAHDTITDLAFLASNEVLYTSAEPSFGIIGEKQPERMHHQSADPDFRSAGASFKISADGATVEFPTVQDGKKRYRFSLFDSLLTPDPAPDTGLTAAVTDDPKLQPRNWDKNSTNPTIAGHAVALEPNEHVRSIAVMAHQQQVAFGTDFYLRAVGADAATVWKTILPAPAWAVDASPDGRYVVAGLGDGTIRWYGATDGHEILGLFVDGQDGRWAAWLPEGYFDHSQEPGKPGGETLLGYQIDHTGKLADFVTFGQLYDHFFRRDLVVGSLKDAAAGAVVAANEAEKTGGDFRSVLKTGMPPSVTLLSACILESTATDCADGASLPPSPDGRHYDVSGTGKSVLVRYRISDRGGGLGAAIIRRDNAAVNGARKTENEDAKQRVETVAVPLQADTKAIVISTVSASGNIELPPDESVVISPKVNFEIAVVGTDENPDVVLYAIIVGISGYTEPDFRLRNAANDAQAMADLLNKPTPKVYHSPVVIPLIDKDATNDKILAALGDVAKKARPQDLVVLFLAGHGDTIDGRFYFAPVDFGTSHPDLIDEAHNSDAGRQGEIVQELFKSDGLGQTALLPVLESIEGNVLLIFDTCFSGSAATEDTVSRARHDTATRAVGVATGRFILTGAYGLASDSNTKQGAGGHGLFTSVLLDGLNGHAARDGMINVSDLLIFARDKMKVEAKKMNSDQQLVPYFAGSDIYNVRSVGATMPTEVASVPSVPPVRRDDSVQRNAGFQHDAGFNLPEPLTVIVIGVVILGLLIMLVARKVRKK